MKKSKSVYILGIGCPSVVIVWLISLCVQKTPFDVGALEPLFTGLAFVAVIATFISERDESRKQLSAGRCVAQIGIYSAQIEYFRSVPTHDKEGRPIEKQQIADVVTDLLAARAKEQEILRGLSGEGN